MTDKKIIIDGVDVAKCRCFTSEWDFNNCGHICKETECKYKRLWYKKQLKAKEQECEELSKTLAEIKDIAEDHCIFCQKIDPETFDMSECKNVIIVKSYKK